MYQKKVPDGFIIVFIITFIEWSQACVRRVLCTVRRMTNAVSFSYIVIHRILWFFRVNWWQKLVNNSPVQSFWNVIEIFIMLKQLPSCTNEKKKRHSRPRTSHGHSYRLKIVCRDIGDQFQVYIAQSSPNVLL